MPITNRPDPDYEPEELQSFADGQYKVNGIHWFTADEEGAPIFVVQANSTNLVARYRTVMSDSDGPPGSVTPGEIPLLVKAFGGDPKQLPSRDDPSAFLIAARDLVNKASKNVTVTVAGGWVTHIPGMSLPKDKYFRFRVSRITTRNEQEQPAWKEGTYGRYIGIEFVVASDMAGNKSPYDGATIWESISYGLKADDSGNPTFTRKDDGSPTPAAAQTDRFLGAFCPSIYEAGFENPGNVMPEFWELYKKDKREALTQVIQVGRDSKRIGLNVYGFAAVDAGADAGDSTVEMPSRDVNDEAKGGSLLQQVYDLIETVTPERAFDAGGKLNKVGKAWCKINLAPFLTERSWPKRFDMWDADQQSAVLEHLTNVVGGDDDGEDF